MKDRFEFFQRMARSYRWSSPLLAEARSLPGFPKETRGRPRELSGEEALRQYIELQARAVILTKGQLVPLLKHPRLRLADKQGKPMRLNDQDRMRLRKRYRIGKVEVDHWRRMRLHYGHPGGAPRPEGEGEDCPEYLDILQRIEARVAELRENREALLFLMGM